MRIEKKKKGFTLIELLIVVAIIGILAAIAIPNFLNAQTRSKVSRAKADMASIVTCIETYRVDNNEYPPTEFAQEDRYAHLIEPIEYIKDVPPDPFGSGEPGTFQNPDTGYLSYYTYDFIVYYAPEILWGFGPDWWSNMIANTSVKNPAVRQYYLSSAGPDLRVGLDANNNPEFMATTYDPTNGTISLGDIHRIGP